MCFASSAERVRESVCVENDWLQTAESILLIMFNSLILFKFISILIIYLFDWIDNVRNSSLTYSYSRYSLMIKDWLTLYFTPQIGIRRFHHLLQSFTDIHEILSADNRAWQAVGIPQSAQSRRDDPKIGREVETSLTWLNASPLHHII